jgi:hypothetical protein
MYGHIDYCKATTFVLSKISNVVELDGSRLNVMDNKHVLNTKLTSTHRTLSKVSSTQSSMSESLLIFHSH